MKRWVSELGDDWLLNRKERRRKEQMPLTDHLGLAMGEAEYDSLLQLEQYFPKLLKLTGVRMELDGSRLYALYHGEERVGSVVVLELDDLKLTCILYQTDEEHCACHTRSGGAYLAGTSPARCGDSSARSLSDGASPQLGAVE